MGGEKKSSRCCTSIGLGSPPRGRGKVVYLSVSIFLARITPAWAGKRPIPQHDSISCWDHPRIGGEKSHNDGVYYQSTGSPPRRQGKDTITEKVIMPVGITPAWAGKSRPFSDRQRRTGDHPRAGGEKFALRNMMNVNQGSPPHRRGKVHPATARAHGDRITPAQAGKSCSDCRCSNRRWDHPRVGGEKASLPSKLVILSGSPPRGRGKARHLSHGLLPCG